MSMIPLDGTEVVDSATETVSDEASAQGCEHTSGDELKVEAAPGSDAPSGNDARSSNDAAPGIDATLSVDAPLVKDGDSDGDASSGDAASLDNDVPSTDDECSKGHYNGSESLEVTTARKPRGYKELVAASKNEVAATGGERSALLAGVDKFYYVLLGLLVAMPIFGIQPNKFVAFGYLFFILLVVTLPALQGRPSAWYMALSNLFWPSSRQQPQEIQRNILQVVRCASEDKRFMRILAYTAITLVVVFLEDAIINGVRAGGLVAALMTAFVAGLIPPITSLILQYVARKRRLQHGRQISLSKKGSTNPIVRS
ncbi:MAG: hypothetical protein K2X29_02665, partial [Candidatus Obscuribacterales bacterium]|nr:hypothetical protein [Candidatus Obscuribacterales bacterium]